MAHFSASGKLLLFGEYLVLRDAKCLSIPLSFGQEMNVEASVENDILWKSFELDNEWMNVRLSNELKIIDYSDLESAETVQKLLLAIQKDNPVLQLEGLRFTFKTNFNRHFGFGTSSTLISLLSQWSNVNPYTLLQNSFGGSGYDIAAAISKSAIVYTIKEKVVHTFDLPESITENLLFVYLGKKQKSATEISKFSTLSTTSQQIEQMNTIVDNATSCQTIEQWEQLMNESEILLSSILNVDPVKQSLFDDYPYSIKSLGAWGGDFVMATFRDLSEAKHYFQTNINQPVFTYNELIHESIH
jgi:mevalonate kinase